LQYPPPDEIQAAYLLRDKMPPAKPRLNDVLRQIACIGGFLARKGDGEPGVKTVKQRAIFFRFWVETESFGR